MPLPAPVLTHAHMRAPKGIVYGPPGVGKTTFGAGADMVPGGVYLGTSCWPARAPGR
jgi:hypothetical protein